MAYIDPQDQLYVGAIFYASEILWLWAVTFVKISVALLLLRIKRDWLWGMLFLAALQIIIAIASTVVRLLGCTPVAAAWDPTLPNIRCWRQEDIIISVYVLSGRCIDL
jgi:hypothetical protein